MKKYSKNGFTLIEMIIAVSIFSIIMISIMSVYLVSTNITYKSYINRIMHENSKNIIITLSEDIMKNGIFGVSKDSLSSNCSDSFGSEKYLEGNKFCTGKKNDITGLPEIKNKYFLAVKDDTGDFYFRKDNNFCGQKENECFIVKNGEPLNNNSVKIKNLRFFMTDEKVRKLTISLTLAPSKKTGVNPSMIQKTELITQLTLTKRLNKK